MLSSVVGHDDVLRSFYLAYRGALSERSGHEKQKLKVSDVWDAASVGCQDSFNIVAREENRRLVFWMTLGQERGW